MNAPLLDGYYVDSKGVFRCVYCASILAPHDFGFVCWKHGVAPASTMPRAVVRSQALAWLSLSDVDRVVQLPIIGVKLHAALWPRELLRVS